MPDYSIPAASALVIIDMQVALVAGAWREVETLANIKALVAAARTAAVPVIYVQHNHASYPPMFRGADGWAVHPDIAPASSDLVIEKTASDAFYQTSLAEALHAGNIEHIVVTGMQSEYCVDTTCRAALSLGFSVTLVADGHTTGDDHLPADQIVAQQNVVMANLAHPHHQIAVVPTAEMRFG